jgi:hypothetical protein
MIYINADIPVINGKSYFGSIVVIVFQVYLDS